MRAFIPALGVAILAVVQPAAAGVGYLGSNGAIYFPSPDHPSPPRLPLQSGDLTATYDPARGKYCATYARNAKGLGPIRCRSAEGWRKSGEPVRLTGFR